MKVIIGSKNKNKVEALVEIVAQYDFLASAEIFGLDVDSQVADQPKSLKETVGGAKNRAEKAFKNCDLGVGVEDGLMEVEESLTGFMNVCVCALYDGKRYYLGLSAAFEYPPKAVDLVEKGMDINQAFYSLGLTENSSVGSAEGAIGILTRGRWNRKETAKQAITSALIQLENKELYQAP